MNAYIKIRREPNRPNRWIWFVIKNDETVFSCSDFFNTFDDAAADVKKHGALAIKRATKCERIALENK